MNCSDAPIHEFDPKEAERYEREFVRVFNQNAKALYDIENRYRQRAPLAQSDGDPGDEDGK